MEAEVIKAFCSPRFSCQILSWSHLPKTRCIATETHSVSQTTTIHASVLYSPQCLNIDRVNIVDKLLGLLIICLGVRRVNQRRHSLLWGSVCLRWVGISCNNWRTEITYNEWLFIYNTKWVIRSIKHLTQLLAFRYRHTRSVRLWMTPPIPSQNL